MTELIHSVPTRALDVNGDPVVGAKLRFYLSGTSTAVVVYSDIGETVAHPTPILSDAGGVFPAVYYSGGAIRSIMTGASDESLPGGVIDPVQKTGAGTSGADSITISPTILLPYTNTQEALEGLAAITASQPLAAISDVGSVPASRILYTIDVNEWGELPITVFSRTLLQNASAAAGRNTLELGTSAVEDYDDIQAYVLAQVAAIKPVGSVGDMGFFGLVNSTSAIDPGDQIDGSLLRWAGIQRTSGWNGGSSTASFSDSGFATAPNGIWEARGHSKASGSSRWPATMFVRIS